MKLSTKNNQIIKALIELGRIKVDATNGIIYRVTTTGVTHQLRPRKVDGYLLYQFTWAGKYKYFSGHRIIWIAVHGDIPPDKTIDHLNRVRHDNRLVNLRLATIKQQRANSKETHGEHNVQAKLTEANVVRLRQFYKAGKSLKDMAKEMGVSIPTAYKAAVGLTWKHIKD